MSELVEKYFRFTNFKGKNSCWHWTGSKLKKDGRGTVCANGKTITAPRLAWYVYTGEWPPDNMMVCHSCDNPNCVNPHHLWLGTNSQNIKDAAKKGRLFIQRQTSHIQGSKHGNAKMDENKVRQMRADYLSGASIRSIARKAGMSFFPVWNAIKGDGWRHVK